MVGPGTLFSYGCVWANLSNTPLTLTANIAES